MTKRDLPAPFYAAAGAGDLAYQRLRKLPEAAERTLRAAGDTATTLRERVATGEPRWSPDRLTADLAKLRESAQRGATTVAASAAVVQQKAVTGYRNLIAHGEQVMAVRNGAAAVDAPPAEITDVASAAEPVVDEDADGDSATPGTTSPTP